MMSQARCTALASEMVGPLVTGVTAGVPFAPSDGLSQRPLTMVFFPSLGFDSHDASPGIGIPPLTLQSALNLPSSRSGTSLFVFGTSSIAANLAGSLL